MRKGKRILCAFCIMCLLVNSLAAMAAEEISDTPIETISETNKRPILTLSLGNGTGQVGYSGSEQFGFTGPNAFAVENDTIYVMDNENSRVILYQNNAFSEFSINQCPRATHMKYQQQKLGIVDNYSEVTGIYSTSGQLITLISHPAAVADEFIADLIEIGDSYVIWKTYKQNYYRYDWIDGTMEVLEEKSCLPETAQYFFSEEGNINREIDTENKEIEVLGTSSEALVYQQLEFVPDVDLLLMELSVRKIADNGQETYAILDFSDWHAPALEPLYFSESGIVYVMECFENCTVISEVLFGTTDVSHMDELEARAEERRAEINQAAAETESNTMTISLDRNQVFSRAHQMATLTWTVQDGHKVKPAANSNYVTIPSSVLNTPSGSTYQGIPYCWGGSNGLDNLNMGASFISLANTGAYTAGNVNDDIGQHTSGTIGIDCSGFVASAYKLTDASKPGTSYFTSFGHNTIYKNLKLMDFLITTGHVVLFYERDGDKIVTYESHATKEDGKVERVTRSAIEMANAGYVARSPFCVTCNKSGTTQISFYGHAFTCSVCGYLWPTEEHTFVNGECSGCGFRQ